MNLTKNTNSNSNKKTTKKEIANLYAKIGELMVERCFLKKTLDS